MAVINEEIATHLILDEWRKIAATYSNIDHLKKLEILAIKKNEILGTATVISAMASEVAILSTASSAKLRAKAAAQESARVAANGNGSLAAPFKTAPHIERMTTNIESVKNAERLNVLNRDLADARDRLMQAQIEVSRVCAHAGIGDTESTIMEKDRVRRRADAVAAEVKSIEVAIAELQRARETGANAPMQRV